MSEPERPEFNVVEFYNDDTHYYLGRNMFARDAMKLASIMARAAVSVVIPDDRTTRIIVTDGGDNTVFEWTKDKGITFPKNWKG